MILTNKLLGYLNRVFNKDPVEFLALRITCDSGNLAWSVEDTILTLAPTGGTASPLIIDLSQYTVLSLAQFIASNTGYIVPYVDGTANQTLSALVLIEGSNNADVSNGDHLFGYTNLLWAWINACASELELAQAQIVNALAQMDTNTAEDQWLDLLGSYYKVPRNPGELDGAYAPRIISSVLLPSSNNIGMALALEARFAGSSVIITDAITNSGSLIIRDGSIRFNSIFEHNSNVLGVANGLFDVTFAFDFNGPISPTQYVTLLIAAVNLYRAGGTYIRNLVIKNGMSAGVISSSYNVGPILVIIYDQYETIEDAWDWNANDIDDTGTELMQMDTSALRTDAVPMAIQDDYPWDVQVIDQDQQIDTFQADVAIADAAPSPIGDDYDWSAEEPDQDDRVMVIDSMPVGPDAALNPVGDDYDWSAEQPDQDDRMEMASHPVGSDADQAQFFGDFVEEQEIVDEVIYDEFINSDAEQNLPADAWPWDLEAVSDDEAVVDDYPNVVVIFAGGGDIDTEGGFALDTESGAPLRTDP